MMISPQQFDARPISVCVVAGEASGDAQGALLVRALRAELEKRGLRLSAWGSGGPLMKAAGVDTIVHIEELSAMGFAEVMSVYPRISAAAHRLQNSIFLRRPQLTILIDYPGLNMRLMEDAFHLGSCVVYHIPPKIWAHGAARVARLRDCTYLITCILPFEEKLLRSAGVNAKFIGNPLKDEIVEYLSIKEKEHIPERDRSICKVGLVPGSRSGEIERVFPVLVKAYVQTRRSFSGRLTAVVPVASTVRRNQLEKILTRVLSEENATEMRVDILLKEGSSLKSALFGCNYAWVCSGTAALETALMTIPMSVVYRMHWLTYAIAKQIIHLPHVSLVNLCAGREIVPEFIQHDAAVEKLSTHALSILNSREKEHAMKSELLQLRDVFPESSAHQAAVAIVERYMQLPAEMTRRFHYKSACDLWHEEREWGLGR